MQIKPELHIIVPGLCGPLSDTQPLKESREFNQWLKVLSRSKSSSSQANVYNVIASLFKLKIDNDFPSAALTLLANDMYDETKYYMHADPVYLQADLNHAVLTSGEDLTINNKESAALCDSLNQHFQQDGLDFFVLENKQWFVAANKDICMKTTPLIEAVGRNVNFILPEGEASTQWRQLLTEAQMLLHSHEVNVDRENTGQAIINSLWFHGCGGLPASSSAGEISSVCSNQAVVKGLSSLVNCDYSVVPATVDVYTEQLLARNLISAKATVNVLHLSELEHLVNYTDVSLWLDKLMELLTRWIYPLLTMAHNNAIEVVLYDCNKKQYQFSKYDSLYFWRSAWGREKIEQYVDSY